MKRRASAAHGNAGEEGSIFRALSSCRWGAQHWPPGGFLTRAPWWCNREAAWTCQRNKSRIRVFVVYQLIDRSLRPCTQTLDWDFQKRRVICVSTSTWHIYGCCWRDWQPEKEKHSGFWGDLGKIQLLCEITTGFSAMPSSPSESPRFHIRSFAFTFGRKKKVRECNLPVHFTQTSIASLYCFPLSLRAAPQISHYGQSCCNGFCVLLDILQNCILVHPKQKRKQICLTCFLFGNRKPHTMRKPCIWPSTLMTQLVTSHFPFQELIPFQTESTLGLLPPLV